MGTRDVLLSELVEAESKAFGEATVVDEEDRRAVLVDELQDLGIDGGPDRALRSLGAGALVGAQLAHVLHGDDDLEVELFRNAGVHELDLARAGHEAADLLQGTLRRREPDALE